MLSKRSLLIALSGLMLGCSDRDGHREETPSFFTSFTGIPLCNSARVRNAYDERPYKSSGFDAVYDVDVYASAECEKDLISFLRVHSWNKDVCDPYRFCHFSLGNGSSIETKRKGSALRLSYSS